MSEKFETLKQHAEKANLLEDLMRHPGWKFFDAYMVTMSQTHYAEAVKTVDSIAMAKNLGAHHAINETRGWPQREVDATRSVIAHPEEFLQDS